MLFLLTNVFCSFLILFLIFARLCTFMLSLKNRFIIFIFIIVFMLIYAQFEESFYYFYYYYCILCETFIE